jgi:hypothetical protein
MSERLVAPNGIPLTDRHRSGPAMRDRLRSAVIRACLLPCRGAFVLLDHARRDAAALADRDTLVLRPRPDIAAALTACCGTYRSAALSSSSLAGVFDVGRDLPAEPAGVLLLRSISDSEPPSPNRNVSSAGPPSRSSSSSTLTRCAIVASMIAMGYLHRTRSTAIPVITAPPVGGLPGSIHPPSGVQGS